MFFQKFFTKYSYSLLKSCDILTKLDIILYNHISKKGDLQL